MVLDPNMKGQRNSGEGVSIKSWGSFYPESKEASRKESPEGGTRVQRQLRGRKLSAELCSAGIGREGVLRRALKTGGSPARRLLGAGHTGFSSSPGMGPGVLSPRQSSGQSGQALGTGKVAEE